MGLYLHDDVANSYFQHISGSAPKKAEDSNNDEELETRKGTRSFYHSIHLYQHTLQIHSFDLHRISCYKTHGKTQNKVQLYLQLLSRLLRSYSQQPLPLVISVFCCSPITSNLSRPRTQVAETSNPLNQKHYNTIVSKPIIQLRHFERGSPPTIHTWNRILAAEFSKVHRALWVPALGFRAIIITVIVFGAQSHHYNRYRI